MVQSKLNIRNVRSALLLGAATVAALGFSAAAASADETATETVVVTGSRIPQQGLYASSPVTSIGQQEMKLEGTTSLDTLINSLPGAFADYNAVSSVFSGSLGTASVDLRGLGSSRTLVLVDGRRLMPGDPVIPVPDLNQIPAALVDHVEVLTGGASAVYGSDALAGVVNFVMRKDFQGIELDGQYSIAEDSNSHYPAFSEATGTHACNVCSSGFYSTAPHNVWDGGTVDATLLFGANSDNGKGNVTFYLGYRDIKPVLESQRDFSACTAEDASSFGVPDFICYGSSNAYPGRFFSEDADSNAFAGGSVMPTSTQGESAPFDSGTKFNYAPYNYLQRPDTRYTGGAFAHYEVDKQLDIYSSLMFADDHTLAQIAPGAIFLGSGPVLGGEFSVNCTNPYLGQTLGGDPNSFYNQLCNGDPAGAEGTGQADMLVGRRMVENGNRIDDLRHTNYRFVIGAKGDLGDGWSYDVSAQYGTSIFSENYRNEVSASRVEKALQVVDVGGTPTCQSVIDGSDPACSPLNIFQTGGASAESLAYIKATGFKEGSTTEQDVQANLAGDLGSMGGTMPWAKSPIGIAVGAEYRQEQLVFTDDYSLATGDDTGQGGPQPPVTGRYNVSEVYGEVRVPLIQDQELFEDLSLNGGYRYSSYSNAGAVNTYKYGAEWQPVDDIRFRGSYQRAVRAPNILELFTPLHTGLYSGLDPCSGSGLYYSINRLSAAQCARTGVSTSQYNSGVASIPPAFGGVTACPAAQCNELVGGNPNLKPEVSDTKSFGVVLTPTFLDGFTATIDYFDIKVNKAISTYGPNTAIAACAGSLGGLGLSNAAAISDNYCALIHRAGQIGTNPGATAGGSGILFGTDGYVTELTENTGSIQTKGYDFEANYQTDLDDWGMNGDGSLAVNFIGTLTKNFIVTPGAGDYAIGSYDCKGLFGVTCGNPTPGWKHTLRVTWSSPWNFDLSIAWRHMSSVKFDGNNASQPLMGYINRYVTCATTSGAASCGDVLSKQISAYDYIDLAGTWTVAEGVELRAGVNNVFDKAPPLIDGVVWGIGFNANTYPGNYDTMGRLFFMSGTIKM